VPRTNDPSPSRENDIQYENDVLKRLLADAEIEKAWLREQVTSLTRRPQTPAPARLDAPSSRRPAGAEEVTPLRPGLRQLKRQQVRQQIEAVALGLFDRKGIDSTTVEEIAAAVNISSRTFFRYFASKEDILLVVSDEVQGEILAAASGYDGSPGSLLSALLTFSEGLDRRRTELLRMVRLLGQPSLYPGRLLHSRQMEDSLAVIVAHHEGRSEPAAADRALAALAASAMSISMRIWLESGADEPFRDVFVSTLGVLSTLGHAAGSTAV
jgi:AcrR family transcriptional regulator